MKTTLCHYGVVGMKWGIRKAAQSGRKYRYKSLEQKYYEKQSQKLSKDPKVSSERIQKAQTKQRLYTQRDSNREAYARQVSNGASFTRAFLMGPVNSGNYARYRAAEMHTIRFNE